MILTQETLWRQKLQEMSEETRGNIGNRKQSFRDLCFQIFNPLAHWKSRWGQTADQCCKIFNERLLWKILKAQPRGKSMVQSTGFTRTMKMLNQASLKVLNLIQRTQMFFEIYFLFRFIWWIGLVLLEQCKRCEFFKRITPSISYYS